MNSLSSNMSEGCAEQVRRKLDNALLSEADLSDLELLDFIDVAAMQSLMDNFYRLTGMPLGLIDLGGRVLVGIGWQDICTRFHRIHPETCRNCIESDSRLTAGVPKGEFKLYKCKNNLWDVATPIIIGGRQFGNFFMGQFFFEDEPIDYQFFRSQAARYGFDEQDYIAALEKVPRISRDSLTAGMTFFMELANLVSRMGYSNLQLARSLAERDGLMESLRQAKEAAEAANRAKNQFLANMSHELRTPMTGVLGMLDLAMDLAKDPKQQDFLGTAETSARSLLRILNDILDLTKIEAGKLSIKEEPFNLQACVRSIRDIFLPEAQRKAINLAMTIGSDVPPVVVGDHLRLRQVLTNLLGNAVKFTEKGIVEVTVATAGRTAEAKIRISFSVIDSGIGIPAEKAYLIFNSFSQVDNSDTRRYGGTGLGLAISKELVERMGGSIEFESQENRGSRFTVTLPLRVGEPDIIAQHVSQRLLFDARPEESPAQPAAPRILLAEDDATIRQIMAEVLRRSRYELDMAEDGMRAVELWEKEAYDLILMDVQMPRMDGFAATRRIREKERSTGAGHTLIVAMTAHASKQDEEICLDAGMDAYISKPIDLQKSLALIKDLISQQAAA